MSERVTYLIIHHTPNLLSSCHRPQWLLEVNYAPSLTCDVLQDAEVKGPLLVDTMELLNFNRRDGHRGKSAGLVHDNRGGGGGGGGAHNRRTPGMHTPQRGVVDADDIRSELASTRRTLTRLPPTPLSAAVGATPTDSGGDGDGGDAADADGAVFPSPSIRMSHAHLLRMQVRKSRTNSAWSCFRQCVSE